MGSVVPVIGTAIGAAIGGLLGSVLGGVLGGVLGPSKRQPELTLQGAIAPRFGFDPVTGFSTGGDFGIGLRSRNFGAATQPVHEAIQSSTTQLLQGLASTIGQFPKELQERAVPELQRLADEFGTTFQGVRFKGKDVQQQVETFINETMPETFNDIFSPFVERLQRVAPVLAEFDRVIATLKSQQADLLGTLDTARAAILEGPLTQAGALSAAAGAARHAGGAECSGHARRAGRAGAPDCGAGAGSRQVSRQEGALVSFNAELRDLHAAVEVSTGALQAQEAALVASQAALDANRAALEGALQVQETALDEQRQVSETQIRALEATVDAERATIESALRTQEDALKAEREASNTALRALEDTLQATEAAARSALQVEEEALDARERALSRGLAGGRRHAGRQSRRLAGDASGPGRRAGRATRRLAGIPASG